jgi:VWFA-related protein
MPPLPEGAVSNARSVPASGALYVLLLDSLNTEAQHQSSIQQQVLSFVHKLEPETEVAVIALGSNLRILQSFTSDPALLAAAVSRKNNMREAMAQTNSDDTEEAERVAQLTAMQSMGTQLAAQYSHGDTPKSYSMRARAAMTFEALNALARYLEGVPGRKNLIWFADSFPVVLFPSSTQLEQLKSDPGLAGELNRAKQTANLFTLSKIAVYPVSGSGVMSSNVNLADSVGTGRSGGGSDPTRAYTAESLASGSAMAGMEQLAESTGGRAISTNDIESALHRIVRDSNDYYTVGYAPANAATDGSFRRIDVKVTGGKYKLAYRRGYNASEAAGSGEKSGENPIAPLLQLGMPGATGILYGARVTAAPPQGELAGQNPQVKGPLTRCSVSFTIRAEDVSFSQSPDGRRIGRLLVGVKAYGQDGAALNWQASREAIDMDAAHYEAVLKSGVPVTVDLDVPAGVRAQLVTAVYDWDSGRSGSLAVPVR